MSDTKRCPQCQAEIPAAAPEGLCPQCLLQAGLLPKTAEAEAKTAPFSPSGSRFEPPTPEALQPAFPQLEILELLGKGGMGAVYKARQPGLDRLVAVKILPPEVGHDPAFAERFTREARALAMLNHPNIVGVYDSGRTGGYYYFVMEYIDGVNLRQAMRTGELKSAEALKIVPQICEALQFAHDEGIVHRDIKPENILLDKKGRVKIADFGLAKLLGRTAADVSLTGTQQVMGTMHYMAPEQIEGSRDVDHRADIYSLGVTFYEMLTGELPIGRFAAPSKKVQIDVRLDEVVLRSLEKEPELRYQHASEIKTEIETIASGPVAEAAGPSTAKLDTPISVPYAGVIPTGPFDPGAFGILHFDGVFLEFEITKRGFFSNSRLQSVRIPLAEVKSMWVEQGKPLGWGLPAPRLWSLYLRTNRMRALDDLPFGSQGQVQIFLEPANVAAAQELQKAVSQSLKRYQPGSEIKTEVEGIIRTPDSPADAKETAKRIDSQTLAWSLFVMVVLCLLAIYVSGFSVLVIVLGLAACGKVGQELIKMSRKDRASETKTEVEGIVGTPAPAASEAVADELEQLVLKNPYSKPLAIRMFRDKTGASLKDATAAVEAIAQKHGIHLEPTPTPQSIRAERIVLILIVAGMGMAIFIGIFGAVLYKYALSFIVVIGLPIIGAHVFAAIAIFHEWWIRPSAFLTKLWRTSLLIVGALSMLIFLKPIARLGAGLHGADEISVGIWPWLSFSNNDVEPDFQLFASWSLLAFPVGWLAFWTYRQSFAEAKQDLAKEPEQRNQQASEIKTDVETIAHESGVPQTEPPASEPTQTAPAAGYFRFVVAPTAALCALLFLAGFVLAILFQISGIQEDNVAFALGLIFGIAIVLVALMFPILNAVWFYRAEVRAMDAKSTRRLWLFQVLGAILVLASLSGIFALMADFLVPPEIPAWLAAQPELAGAYEVYRIGYGAVSYVLNFANIAVGVGLILRLPWCRRCAIALTLIDAVLILMVQAPIEFAFEFQAIPADPIPLDAEPQNSVYRALNLNTHDARVDFLIGSYTFRAIWLLVLNLLVVFYLARPHVRKLFGENNAPAVGTAGPEPTEASGIPA